MFRRYSIRVLEMLYRCKAWLDAILIKPKSALFSVILCGGCAVSHDKPIELPRWLFPTDYGSSLTRLSEADVLRFASIGVPGSPDWRDYAKQTAVWSPDSRFAVVAVTRTNPISLQNETVALVYELNKFEDRLQLRDSMEFQASGNQQPFSKVVWIDNERFIFAAARGRSPAQIHLYQVYPRTYKQLTSSKVPLRDFSISQNSEYVVAFRDVLDSELQNTNECRYPEICRITADNLQEATYGRSERHRVFVGKIEVTSIQTGKNEEVTSVAGQSSAERINYCYSRAVGAPSPEARFLLVLCNVKSWPRWWERYSVDLAMKTEIAKSYTDSVNQIHIVDLKEDKRRVLIDAPLPYRGSKTRVIWSKNGSSAIVAGVHIPPHDLSISAHDGVFTTWSIVELDLENDTFIHVDAFEGPGINIADLDWNEAERLLETTITGQNNERVVYRWRKEELGWLRESQATSLGVVVDQDENQLFKLRQSLDEPPELWAESPITGDEYLLLAPNVWLDSRRLGHIEKVTWTTEVNEEWEGLVYLPPEFDPKRIYPLLLQTHQVKFDEFSLSGTFRNNIARLAAANDIIVLHVADLAATRSVRFTPQQWSKYKDGYEAAINHMEAHFGANPNRVGIIGWSRTMNSVGYFLANTKIPIAAAALLDGLDIGWTSYLRSPPAIRAYMRMDYGAQPFGEGLKDWINLAPTFRLHNVDSPTLLWKAQDGGLAGIWDWYAGLSELGIPVELWHYKNGTHDLYDPRDRLHANRLLMDWFKYWLQDVCSSGARGAQRCERWDALRARHEQAPQN